MKVLINGKIIRQSCENMEESSMRIEDYMEKNNIYKSWMFNCHVWVLVKMEGLRTGIPFIIIYELVVNRDDPFAFSTDQWSLPNLQRCQLNPGSYSPVKLKVCSNYQRVNMLELESTKESMLGFVGMSYQQACDIIIHHNYDDFILPPSLNDGCITVHPQ